MSVHREQCVVVLAEQTFPLLAQLHDEVGSERLNS